jgi:EF-hand domain pair
MQIDGDGNGTIDLKELGKALELVGIKVPGYELRDMISTADTGRDDVIDIEEFKEVRVSLCYFVLLIKIFASLSRYYSVVKRFVTNMLLLVHHFIGESGLSGSNFTSRFL